MKTRVQGLLLPLLPSSDEEGSKARPAAVLCPFIKKVAASAFVPPRFVRVAWQAIKAEAPTASCLQEFLDYFEETWLTGTSF